MIGSSLRSCLYTTSHNMIHCLFDWLSDWLIMTDRLTNWLIDWLTNQSIYLFVQELACVLLDVSLVQVGGEAHQTHLRQAKVSQLDVAHGRDQQTTQEENTLENNSLQTNRSWCWIVNNAEWSLGVKKNKKQIQNVCYTHEHKVEDTLPLTYNMSRTPG